jgi:hypothetical protein
VFLRVDIIRFDEAGPPVDTCRLLGCKVVARPLAPTIGKILADKVTLPEKPPRLFRVIVEVPFLPAWIISELGLAIMEKSGGGGGNTFRKLVITLFEGILSTPDGFPAEGRTVTLAMSV